MIQDVLALEGFLMEPLPSHLRSALGLCFPSVLFQMGSLEDLQPGQGPASGVYLGKDMWHPGRVRSKAGIGWLRSHEPGRGQEVWQAPGASLPPAGTICQGRSSAGEDEGCSWCWNRLGAPRGDRALQDLWDSSWCPHLELFLTLLLLHLLSVSFTRQGKSRDCLGGTSRYSIMGRVLILQHPQSQILWVCGAKRNSEK